MATKYQTYFSATAHFIAAHISRNTKEVTAEDKIALCETSVMFYERYLEISERGGGACLAWMRTGLCTALDKFFGTVA